MEQIEKIGVGSLMNAKSYDKLFMEYGIEAELLGFSIASLNLFEDPEFQNLFLMSEKEII